MFHDLIATGARIANSLLGGDEGEYRYRDGRPSVPTTAVIDHDMEVINDSGGGYSRVILGSFLVRDIEQCEKDDVFIAPDQRRYRVKKKVLENDTDIQAYLVLEKS
ncbi:hypothetical protein [Agarilytica rhodophyticola]|uniref:hypothetical protein n=1 Tax=Agarilytica rhodophyticola TaxID=1737490 RepID=UPI000B3452AF|nr:hypothetical protein [Agarilytica rhodophyticola]